jgi:tetratricopeptide (TPR) repeat protein
MISLTLTRRIRPLLFGALSMMLVVLLAAPASIAQNPDKDAAEKYNEGLTLLKDKNYEGALNTFLEAQDMAEKAGDEQTASKAENYAYRLFYNVGVGYVKEGDLEKALDYFQRGIDMEPSYYKNYKGRAIVYQREGDDAKAMEAFIETANIASESGELEERSKAIDQAEGFVAQAMQAEDYEKVIENGKLFLQFSETPMVHYYMSHAYNALGDYQNALAHADKALELDQGSRASKAKIHFEKAEAYRNSGQFDQAKAAYAEAAYGEFKQRAEYMIEELSGSN